MGNSRSSFSAWRLCGHAVRPYLKERKTASVKKKKKKIGKKGKQTSNTPQKVGRRM